MAMPVLIGMNVGSKQKAEHPKAAYGLEHSVQSKIEFLFLRTFFVDVECLCRADNDFFLSCRGSNTRRTTNPPPEKLTLQSVFPHL